MAGYRLLISVLSEKAVQEQEVTIDNNNFDEESLIELRIPMSLPYQNRQTGFERYYGEIKLDGKIYTYVKMKIDGDQVVLKCLPNKEKQYLVTASGNMASANSSHNMDQTGKKHSFSAVKTIGADYENRNQFFVLCHGLITNNSTYFNYYSALPEISIMIPHQPPKC